MKLDPKKVQFWLDTNPIKEQPLSKVCKPENQAEFLEIALQHPQYEYNGIYLIKKPILEPIDELQEYFSTFDFKHYHETPYGSFQKGNFKKFVLNQIECAKNHKMTRYRVDAIKTLTKLKEYLSTKKVKPVTTKAQVQTSMVMK